jgi:hypothetical protein
MLPGILVILIGVELGWEVGATSRVRRGVEAFEMPMKGWMRVLDLEGLTGRGLSGFLLGSILTFLIMNQYKIN